MLGEEITDPLHVEHEGAVAGLALLPLRTEMHALKTTQIASGTTLIARLFGQAMPALCVAGYEIHVGKTQLAEGTSAFARLKTPHTQDAEFTDGCISADSRIFGTYLHGLFDVDEFRHAFLAAARAFHGLTPSRQLDAWKEKREQSFDRLADTLRDALDLPQLFAWVGLTYRGVVARR